jgi:regulatory protein YycI of two-component signal transduction system YycFG
MPDDIAENLAIPNTVLIDGKEYKMKPIGIRDLGEIQAYIKKQKVKDWLEIAKDLKLDDIEKGKELKTIMNSSVTDVETFDFLDTIQGKRILFYYVLKDNPGVTMDSINDLIRPEAAQQIIDSLSQEVNSPSEDRAEAIP